MTVGLENSSLFSLNTLPPDLITQAVINSIADPIVVFDTAGEACIMNRAAEVLLKESTSRHSGDMLRHFDPSVRAVFRQLCAHVLDGQEPYVAQGQADMIHLSCQEGEKCFLPRATPLYTLEGQFIGVTVLLHEAVEADPPDEGQEELLATLIHDLRTPLTSLKAAVRLCLEQTVGPLTEKQARLLDIAREGCERLQATLEGLADRRAPLRTKHSSSNS